MSDKTSYKIYGVYDTETTNITHAGKHLAFPILFIYNDISNVDLATYTPNVSEEHLTFDRTVGEFTARLESVIENAKCCNEIPIICAYNLMFDLQPLLSYLTRHYACTVAAQSSTHVYTFDIYDLESGEQLLRFWDTYYLNNSGLAAMGTAAGFVKAVGDWDYSLIRTDKTPITQLEMRYATRDVQVIPAYLRFLLEANEWLEPNMFGVNVLTKTSLVRQMAKRELGKLKYITKRGNKYTLFTAFKWFCEKEQAFSYEQMRLRQACFRGGLTFTAMRYAGVVVHNVYSLDVTSMHHLFINGAFVPQDFHETSVHYLQIICEATTQLTSKYVLESYGKPFPVAYHAQIRFYGLRLKQNSAFAAYGIGLLAQGKFHANVEKVDNERDSIDESQAREEGYIDTATGATFAFGKLVSAETCSVYVCEIELFNISRVYEWDGFEVLYGESTGRFCRPPDYVTLQSNVLFERKQEAKKINKFLTKNGQRSYPYEIADSIPSAIAAGLKEGTITPAFFAAYYNEQVKGQFNGCYGVQAQNIYKPEYIVDCNGEITIDPVTKCTNETFELPDKNTVLYTYGMRIVGGSRMHLILAIELIYNEFGERCKITGGDTDSLKIACDQNIQPKDLLRALTPLHKAAKQGIEWTQERLRSTWNDKASSLTCIGEFDVENEETPYISHIEYWNKCRISWDGAKVHVTCAGLSRFANSDVYDIEDALTELSVKHGFDNAVTKAFGYNVEIDNNICHFLQRDTPKTGDVFSGVVTDYLNNKTVVNAPRSIALYEANRVIGETTKLANLFSVQYLQHEYSRELELVPRTLKQCPLTGTPFVRNDVTGEMILY